MPPGHVQTLSIRSKHVQTPLRGWIQPTTGLLFAFASPVQPNSVSPVHPAPVEAPRARSPPRLWRSSSRTTRHRGGGFSYKASRLRGFHLQSFSAPRGSQLQSRSQGLIQDTFDATCGPLTVLSMVGLSPQRQLRHNLWSSHDVVHGGVVCSKTALTQCVAFSPLSTAVGLPFSRAGAELSTGAVAQEKKLERKQLGS